MLQTPLFGTEPAGLTRTVRPEVTRTVNVADAPLHPGGWVAPAPGTYPSTVAVAAASTPRLPPKKSFMSGVRKVNGRCTMTVIVLPGPAPPVAAEQTIGPPTEFAHDVV